MTFSFHEDADTFENLENVVGVMAWFLLATTILAVVARLSTKYTASHVLGYDDLLITCACVSYYIAKSFSVGSLSLNDLAGSEHWTGSHGDCRKYEWPREASLDFAR